MNKRYLCAILAIMLALCALTGCKTDKDDKADSDEKVTLKVVAGWVEFKALDVIAEKFTEKYPNCEIVYEYLQDYYSSLEKRLEGSEDKIDLFISTGIQKGETAEVALPYALDLYSREDIDLSQAFEGLVKNFEYRDANEGERIIYSVPLGAEVRGMYVNKTLLSKFGLKTPTNQAEFMECCRVLYENGYTPMQGNPGYFGQQMLYPWVANIIAHSEDYDNVYERINSREAGISELFREPMEFLYEIISNYYYNYKLIENTNGFYTDMSDEGICKYFLNIVSDGENFVKQDDIGTTAFMPSTMSLKTSLDKCKSDYHSEIEYEFIMSPVGTDGGFAYISPSHGIAVNKNSDNLDWAAKFVDFIFQSENNELMNSVMNLVPNTKDTVSYISKQFDVPENHVCELGQVTFNYGFYGCVKDSLVEISKGNNPKYMQNDGTEFYSLDYYMERLEMRLTDTMPEE